MFGKQWMPAEGTVVATRIAGTSGDGTVSTTEFVVEVRTPDGETFRAKVGEPRIVNDFKSPIVGAVARVEFDPKSRKVRFDKSDPRLSWKAYEKAQQNSFDAALNQAPDSQPATAAADPRLAQLQAFVQATDGGVTRLDPNNPDTAALRDMLLRATGGRGAASAADPAGPTGSPTEREA